MSLKDRSGSRGKKAKGLATAVVRDKSKEKFEIQNDLIQTINHRAPTSALQSLQVVSFWEGIGLVNK
jgi:hypothetical protein